MSASSDLTFRVFVNKVKSVAESSGLKLSQSIFSISNIPKTIMDLGFCIDLQTQDTGKYRGYDERIRISHRLTILFAKKIKPLDQFTSQLESLDIEEKVIASLSDRNNFPDAIIDWKSTRRTIVSSREYQIVEIAFDCESDWSFASF